MNYPKVFSDHIQFVCGIRNGEVSAFEAVFNAFYAPLVNFARGILKDDALAEEQVQEVFVQLWEKRGGLKDEIVLFPYLITSVRNKCINQIQHRKVQKKYELHVRGERTDILHYEPNDVTEERLKKLYEALNGLPEKCRQVFELSRFQHLSHKEIAAELNISTKTVENQITKALKVLKKEMTGKALFLLNCVGVLFS